MVHKQTNKHINESTENGKWSGTRTGPKFSDKVNFDLWKAGELLLKITFGSKSDSQQAKYKEMRKTFLETPKELTRCSRYNINHCFYSLLVLE